MEASRYHNRRCVSTGGLEVQSTARDIMYTARGDTRVRVHPRGKASAGVALTRLVEDGPLPNKARFQCSQQLLAKH